MTEDLSRERLSREQPDHPPTEPMAKSFFQAHSDTAAERGTYPYTDVDDLFDGSEDTAINGPPLDVQALREKFQDCIKTLLENPGQNRGDGLNSILVETIRGDEDGTLLTIQVVEPFYLENMYIGGRTYQLPISPFDVLPSNLTWETHKAPGADYSVEEINLYFPPRDSEDIFALTLNSDDCGKNVKSSIED